MRYMMWGRKTKDALDEKVLLSDATLNDCAVVKLLAAKDGWHTFRVVPLTDDAPDFAATLNIR